MRRIGVLLMHSGLDRSREVQRQLRSTASPSHPPVSTFPSRATGREGCEERPCGQPRPSSSSSALTFRVSCWPMEGRNMSEETGLLGQQVFPEVLGKLFFLHPKQILVQALSTQATAVISYLALCSKPFVALCIWLNPVLLGHCKQG